ncbi:ATP-binding cassette sub-family C member 9-like [Ptychodera flava]|uniref:ATP-binding cassette sub-family C member 9-like n=1 Tax=Ptychodera flava TaxID=63121 RepID=UPI00396A0523
MASEDETLQWFCGANSTNFFDFEWDVDGTLHNSCFVNLVDACVHLFFLVVASVVLVVIGCCSSLRHFKSRTLLVYPGHDLRHVIFIVAFIVLLAWIGEGILTDVTRSGPTRPHLYIPPSLAILSCIVSAIYYHYAEYWRRPALAWLLILYWVLALGSKILVLINLVHDEATGVDILRFDVTVLLIIVYCFFFAIEVNLIRAKVLQCCHNESEVEVPGDLQKTDLTFTHRYSSLFTRMTFNWLNWLFALGYKRPLEMEDLGSMSDEHSAGYQYKIFLQAYRKEKERAAKKNVIPSLFRTQCNAYGRSFFHAGALLLISVFFGVIGPLGIGVVISYATEVYYGTGDDKDDVTDMSSYVTVYEFFGNGFVMVIVIFLSVSLKSFTFQYGFYIMIMKSIHFRTSLQCHVYEKSIRLASWTITGGERTMGQITNHMSVDALSVHFWYVFAHQMWLVPTQVVLLLILLYSKLGYSALIGASVFVVTTPIQMMVGTAMSKAQRQILKYADERLKKCNELLQGIKLLKLYGWEELFCAAIEVVRKTEIRKMLNYGGLMAATIIITMATPAIMTLISFSVYSSVSPTPLTPDITFSALALFQQLVMPLVMFPMTIGFTVNAVVSLSRLQKFFVASEVEENDDGRAPLSSVDIDSTVEISAQEDLPESGDKEKLNLIDQEDADLIDDDDADTAKLLSKEVKPYGSFEQETSLMNSQLAWSSSASAATVPDDLAITIRNGSYTWDIKDPVPVLSNINLDVPVGKLTMIVGLVGSGKSSLLSAMLGEMTTVSGTVQFNRRKNTVAYGGQKAWLQNASLRDNILFGESYDHQRYQEIINACALQPDIDILPGGDKTEIGEKGINLSGGQKQRVSIARAMYSKADVIMLDDPLSALDVHVGGQVMAEGIKRFLFREERTVILVTHQLQHIQNADKVVVMEGGKIIRQGDLNDIATNDPELYASWQRTLTVLSESEQESESEAETADVERQTLMRQISAKKEADDIAVKAGATIIEEEERERGSVSWRIYMSYVKAAKVPLFGIGLLLIILRVTAQTFTNFWLSRWSESGANFSGNISQEELDDDLNYWISGYAALSVTYIFLLAVSSTWLIVTLIFAARRLYKTLLRNVVHLPLRFFDTTPVGRILNRFSNDTQILDMRLWQTLQGLLDVSFATIAAIIVNAIVTPLFLLLFIPVFIGYAILQNYYINTSRELQRLDSITKSPVFAHFSESLGGLSTIRGYRVEQRFRGRLIHKIGYNNLAFIYLQVANRWVAVRLDICGSLIVLVSGMATLITSAVGGLEPSLVGLALSYALQISGLLNFLIRQVADCEMQMNAVERVSHYSNIENETYEGTLNPSSEWPVDGDVSYQDVSVRYAADLDPVLTDITLKFKAGEKIGICGRTGSGKSSLALSLFRMIDTYKGRVCIDGIDISHVPLLTLRKRLAIIPQDPILFTGTIRFNLDPEGTKDDKELWEALEIAQLKSTVMELDKQLGSEISEGGENFSVGQRQLFCLARAFLRKARILVMDEATASIDMKTDAILQNVVATAFQDMTVLTIAHRVSTILDSDTILVLSEGEVVEYDTPENLLKNEDGIFASLVKGNK